MNNFLRSKTTHIILWAIGGAAVLLLAFGAGMSVGYSRGLFSSRFGENYYRNFYGMASSGPPGMMGMTGGAPSMNQHGTVGVVIDVTSSSISAQDQDGDEESIAVGTDTVIRDMDRTVTLMEVGDGDQITVIGDPNGSGQIRARFIRIFPENSSTPPGQ